MDQIRYTHISNSRNCCYHYTGATWKREVCHAIPDERPELHLIGGKIGTTKEIDQQHRHPAARDWIDVNKEDK